MKRSVAFVFKIALFALILIHGSCNDDEIGNGRNIDFILATDKGYSDTMAIYCTNQHGDLLYDTIAIRVNKVIKFKVSHSDIVDLNVATKYISSNIRVETFKDIKSGYLLNNSSSCPDKIDQNYGIQGNYELHINGINNYKELSFPSFGDTEIIKDDVNNEIIIKGEFISVSDIIISILPNNSSQYLSYYLSSNSKIEISPGSYKFNIDFQDFQPSIKHEIQLDNSTNWYLNANAITTDGKNVTIKRTDFFSGPSDKANVLTLYSVPLNIEKLKLSVNQYLTPVSFSFQKYFDNFPSNIVIYNPNIEIKEVGSQLFNVNIETDYDLSTTYFWSSSNLTWYIYQKQSDNFLIKSPTFPLSIRNGLNYSGTGQFSGFNVKATRFGTNFNSLFNESSNAVSTFCGESESKSVSQNF